MIVIATSFNGIYGKLAGKVYAVKGMVFLLCVFVMGFLEEYGVENDWGIAGVYKTSIGISMIGGLTMNLLENKWNRVGGKGKFNK